MADDGADDSDDDVSDQAESFAFYDQPGYGAGDPSDYE